MIMFKRFFLILLMNLFFVSCALRSSQTGLTYPDLDYAGTLNERGNSYFLQGEYALAILAYKKAIEIYPGYAKAHSNLGYAHFLRNQFDRAIAEFSMAIEINPRYARAYNNRGLVYFAKGEYDRAFSDYGKAIEIAPGLAKPYDNRGEIYMLSGEVDKACLDFERACQLGECSTYEMAKERGYCKFDYMASALPSFLNASVAMSPTVLAFNSPSS